MNRTAIDEIRAELARRRMTQQQLGALIGRSQDWISRRLNGSPSFTIDEIEAIAAALGIPAARLLEPRTTHH